MIRLVVILAFALLFAGCGGGKTFDRKTVLNGPITKVKPPAGQWEHTPQGGAVWVPAWLNAGLSASKPAVFAEIDSTLPLNVAGPPGVPVHWKLVILDPGLYPFTEGGKPVLAGGHTDYQKKQVFVAFRSPNASGPYLDGFAHELAHAVTMDPKVNH